MLKRLKQLTVGLTVLGSIGVYSFAVAPAASAFTLIDNGSIGIDEDDVNEEFTIIFDGNVNESDVTELTSEAIFKFLGFTTVGGNTEAKFDITLDNTSSDGITSRTSGLGFNVTDFSDGKLSLLFAQESTGPGQGTGKNNETTAELTRIDGLFENAVANGKLPNQFGNLDVCFSDGNCTGGKDGSVKTNDEPQKFTATLALSGDVKKFALNNFGVRYQSIDGNGMVGASGTGRGTVSWDPPTPQPREIPEPTTATALLLVGLGAFRYGKRKQKALVEQTAG